ncbi:MAG: hypothetical protein QG627_211 [Chlamydiota bacterium]|jgi:hypothetical protein|nr:hypothetical protein [Chlamydiota bacterium]
MKVLNQRVIVDQANNQAQELPEEVSKVVLIHRLA